MYYRRRLKSYNLYTGLLIGCIITAFQFISDYVILATQLNGNARIFTPYTLFIGYNLGPWTVFYYTLIPILASLSLNQLVYQDLKSGYIHYVVKKIGHRKYVFNSFLTTFIGGCLTTCLPLLLNFILYYCTLPNLKPDQILNANQMLTPDLTYLTGVYYSNPFVHVLFYVLLAGLVGGTFATGSLVLICLTRNIFTDFAGMFLLSLIADVLAANTQQAIFSPTLFAIPQCPVYLPTLGWAITELAILLVFFAGCFNYGIKKIIFN
jgi:hypothetical protein